VQEEMFRDSQGLQDHLIPFSQEICHRGENIYQENIKFPVFYSPSTGKPIEKGCQV